MKKNIYIQIFSLDTKINRIFLYSNKNYTKITVECFDHKLDPYLIKKEVLENLKYLNFKITHKDLNFQGYTLLKNYSILSKDDLKIINNFKKIQEKIGLIDCGWDSYGRAPKLNKVFEAINKNIFN